MKCAWLRNGAKIIATNAWKSDIYTPVNSIYISILFFRKTLSPSIFPFGLFIMSKMNSQLKVRVWVFGANRRHFSIFFYKKFLAPPFSPSEKDFAPQFFLEKTISPSFCIARICTSIFCPLLLYTSVLAN